VYSEPAFALASGLSGGPSLAELPKGSEEVDLTESRPIGVAEVELRVGALPEQEVGQPLLAAGSDDHVGIGEARVVEVRRDAVHRDR
jgi:hypothetical protein